MGIDTSLLSPLVLGYHRPDPEYPGIGDAMVQATWLVPAVVTARRVNIGRRLVTANCRTEVIALGELKALYTNRAELVTSFKGDDQAVAAAVGHLWVWQVGISHYQKGRLDGVDVDAEPVVIETSRFQIHDGALVGARQLALFRHLLLGRLRWLDPNLQLVRGTDIWRREMWPIRTLGPVSG